MRKFVVAGILAAGCAAPAAADPIGSPEYGSWPASDGAGSPVYLTYSYSNLLGAGFNTSLTSAELRLYTELAFGLWARYAPLYLYEVPDRGPAPAELPYSGAGTPDIRIGYQPTLEGGEVAHAHLPAGRSVGLSGDIHFSNDVSSYGASAWGQTLDGERSLDFFSVMVHESGHALGLLHLLAAPSVMGDVLFVQADPARARLFAGDIAAVRALYGTGRGGVFPMEAVPTPEPASLLLAAAGLTAALRHVKRRRR